MHPAALEALKYVGSHDGAPFRAHLGLAAIASWCAAFVVTVNDAAVPTNHLPRSAHVLTNWHRANADRLRYEVVTARGSVWGKQVRSGDVVVFTRNPDVPNGAGHTGEVIEQYSSTSVHTVEGNTSCPAAAGPLPYDAGRERDGGCVAVKIRGLGPHSFRLLGFYRERQP